MLKRFLYHTCLILFISSCSSFKIADRKVSKKFERANLKYKIKEVKNYHIHYWDSESDKPVIVLISGFGVAARFQWYDQVNKLEERYRVIVPNLLYFGGSRPINGNHYTVEDQVDMMLALLNGLLIDKFTLCGVSYGGLVSVELAKAIPDQISKLIIFDAPIKFFNQQNIDSICRNYNVSSFAELFVPEHHSGLKDLLAAVYYKPPKIPTFLLKDFYDHMYKPNLHHLKQLLIYSMDNIDRLSEADYKFPFPTLLIWGSDDDIIPIKVGQALKDHMNDCRLEIIPKTKHMPNIENPKLFNEILINFLTE